MGVNMNAGVDFILTSIDILIDLLFGISAVYFAIWLFDGLTKEIAEWKEIKKGNIAVAIYFATVIFSLALIMAPQLKSVVSDVYTMTYSFSEAITIFFLFDLVELVVTIIIAAFLIYVTLKTIDWLSHGMHKFEQLKRGNIAVAIIMSVILLAVILITQPSITHLCELLNPVNLMVVTP